MKQLFSKLTAFLLFTFLLISCDLFNGKEEPATDKFLVSYNLEKTYLKDQIKALLTQYANTYPSINSIKDKVENGVLVYKVTYNTAYKNSELKIASGLVCLPSGDGSFPFFSFHNGTNTLHSEAPTANTDNQTFVLLEFMAGTGFVMVIPDYLGFGASKNMFHPYLHKESTVKSVLDLSRAARELIDNHLKKDRNISYSNDIYLNGYSQGGWTTMQVQKEIETKFNNEFNLKASSCGAGPYDINFVNDYVLKQTTYPMPYYIGYILNTYMKTGAINVKASDILNEPYATRIENMYDGTKSSNELNGLLTTKIADLFTADYLAKYKSDPKYTPVLNAMTDNSVTAWNTKVPTMIFHGLNDTFVPAGVSDKIFQDFIKLGVSTDMVKYVAYPGLDHGTALLPTELATINWFLEIRDKK